MHNSSKQSSDVIAAAATPPPTRLILAPMEGVMDAIMRDMLTTLGGYDRCVTEFVRVSKTVLPSRVFWRLCPELRTGGATAAGTPVYVQLLGSDPELMARNAEVAAKLGAPGIDLNFGCPAKTVNKSEGGAVLLRTPRRIETVCRAVRDAVPRHIPVTAKIRLGFDDDLEFEDIAQSALAGGISELVVHARTRRQAYRPPAHWHRLAGVVANADIPVIANGELWSPTDVQHCRDSSGCTDFMLARGALCRPDLALAVRSHLAQIQPDTHSDANQGSTYQPLRWTDIQPMLLAFMRRNADTYEPRYACNPLKQWLVYLQTYYPQAGHLFAQVKRIREYGEMEQALLAAFAASPPGTIPEAA